MKQILSVLRRAINDFSMIRAGDKIAVGLSGGKDSIVTMLALSELRKFYPEKFELIAITLDMGKNEFDVSPLVELCEKNNIEYIVEKTHIAEIVFDVRKEKSPCSLCANLRRGILYDTAKINGCNKVALGHHRDDLIDTYMMSLFYEGRKHTFSPVTYLSRKDIFIIRPMIYVPEDSILKFVQENDIKIVKNLCPANGETKRQYIKDLLKRVEEENVGVRESIFAAIKNGNDFKIN